MRLKSILIAVAVTLLGGETVMGQNAIDIFRMSETSYSFSTARSAAMGGAFSSLGADGSSASINPAGIGMYRTTDMAITGSSLWTNTSSLTTGPNGDFDTNSKVKNGGLNNMTAMFSVYKDRNKVLRGVTVGFAYNKLNDLSSSQYTSSNYQKSSMLDLFARDLGNISPDRITSNDDDPFGAYRNNSVSLWGGMLAYNTGLLFHDNQFNDYTTGSTLYPGDEVYSDLYLNTTGGKSDNNFSVGFNLLDRIYIGTSLSYQTYNYNSIRSYSEFGNLDAGDNYKGDLDNYEYVEQLNIYGKGFSFKVGATMELFKGFNLALAYHAPTLYTINEEYFADMYSTFATNKDNYFEASTPYSLATYKVSTAPTVLIGASYVIAKRAILSFDYDRVYNSNMKVRSGDFGSQVSSDITRSITNSYKNSNNIRVGAEVRVGSSGYLRAGYAHYGNSEKGIDDKYNSTTNLSGGIGIKFDTFYIDLTYINMQSKTPGTYFYSAEYANGDVIASDDTYTTDIIRNSFIYTMGFKF